MEALDVIRKLMDPPRKPQVPIWGGFAPHGVHLGKSWVGDWRSEQCDGDCPERASIDDLVVGDREASREQVGTHTDNLLRLNFILPGANIQIPAFQPAFSLQYPASSPVSGDTVVRPSRSQGQADVPLFSCASPPPGGTTSAGSSSSSALIESSCYAPVRPWVQISTRLYK